MPVSCVTSSLARPPETGAPSHRPRVPSNTGSPVLLSKSPRRIVSLSARAHPRNVVQRADRRGVRRTSASPHAIRTSVQIDGNPLRRKKLPGCGSTSCEEANPESLGDSCNPSEPQPRTHGRWPECTQLMRHGSGRRATEFHFGAVFLLVVDKRNVCFGLRNTINHDSRFRVCIRFPQNHDVVNGFSKAVVHLESIPG